jgi:hypothetical protein
MNEFPFFGPFQAVRLEPNKKTKTNNSKTKTKTVKQRYQKQTNLKKGSHNSFKMTLLAKSSAPEMDLSPLAVGMELCEEAFQQSSRLNAHIADSTKILLCDQNPISRLGKV